MKVEFNMLYPLLDMENEIRILVNPFLSAFLNKAMEQLEGHFASGTIGLVRLSSPLSYWVLSGNYFTLDLKNPEDPKIVCMGTTHRGCRTTELSSPYISIDCLK